MQSYLGCPFQLPSWRLPDLSWGQPWSVESALTGETAREKAGFLLFPAPQEPHQAWKDVHFASLHALISALPHKDGVPNLVSVWLSNSASRLSYFVTGDANVQIASISEELAKKTEDAARQQEEITHLLSQIVDLQKKAKSVSLCVSG